MADTRRELHLLVPDPPRRRLLATAHEALPTALVTLKEGQTTVGAAAAATGDALGRPLPIVEIHFDYDRDPDAGPVPVLVVTEAIEGAPPEGFEWRVVTDSHPKTAEGLERRLEELLAEWRSGGAPPPLRPRWSRPGWHARATSWLARELTAIGRPPTGPPEQVRHWGISALMRVPTAAGTAWFKAVFPPFHHEPAVTRLLAADFATVPSVLAIEPEEGWLVTDDVGASFAADADPGARAAGAAALVDLQRAMSGRLAEIVELGCPVRTLGTLSSALEAVFREDPLLPGVPPTIDGAAVVRRVEAAIEVVETLGIPDSLIHGDFHGGNVAIVDGRPVIFDWSDAAIGNPLVDLVTWPGPWLDPAVQRHAQVEMLRAWERAGAAAGGGLVDRHDDIVTVGAAYQVVSYAGITRNLEPLRRLELADGIETFLGIAMGGLGAAGSWPATPAVTPGPVEPAPPTSA